MKMRKTWTMVIAGLVSFLLMSVSPQVVSPVLAADSTTHKSVLHVSDASLPAHRDVRIAINKSLMIELPRELRDVVISNPEMVDAVVQASNRVYLIAKKSGQANAFFFDASGERILTLEITVDIDSVPLEKMLRRLIPDSDIKVEMINETVVMSGTVLRPADATKARNLASRFVVAEGGAADKVEKTQGCELDLSDRQRAGDAQGDDC